MVLTCDLIAAKYLLDFMPLTNCDTEVQRRKLVAWQRGGTRPQRGQTERGEGDIGLNCAQLVSYVMNTRGYNGQAKVEVKEQDHWMDRRKIKSVDIVLHHIVADFKMPICATTGTVSNLTQMSTVVSPFSSLTECM